MSLRPAFATSTGPLILAVMRALKSDLNLQAVFGQPARIYDEYVPSAAYPYTVLERCESQAADGAAHYGFEHTLHLAVFARHSGIAACKDLLGVLRDAFERLSLNLNDQRIVLVLPSYSDVLRTKNPTILRGVLRVRLRTEEV